MRWPILFASCFLFACGEKNAEAPVSVSIFFSDLSLPKENPSVQLWIDGKLIAEADSFSVLDPSRIELSLNKGPHALSVQTKEGALQMNDTFVVADSSNEYLLTVEYIYNPPQEEYVKLTADHGYRRILEKNGLRTDTLIPWLRDSLLRDSERWHKANPELCTPGPRHFKMNFRPQPLLE